MESDNPNLMRALSRLMSRSVRVRGGLIGGLRFLAALAVLFGIQAVANVERPSSLDAVVVTPLRAPMPALHSVSLTRMAVAPRASSRSSDDAGAAMRPEASASLNVVRSPRSVTVGAIEQSSRSIVSRGYDATAPPALS